MRHASDLHLQRVLDLSKTLTSMRKQPRDYALSETIASGRTNMIDLLTTKWRAARWSLVGADIELIMLTTIRRTRKEPDPVSIVLAEGRAVSCQAGALPRVTVRFTNQNADKYPVRVLIPPPDAMDHQHVQFRLLVRSVSSGVLVSKPILSRYRVCPVATYALSFGESQETVLAMDEFLEPLPPGEFTMVVQYHPDIPISHMPASLESLILLESAPVRLTVK